MVPLAALVSDEGVELDTVGDVAEVVAWAGMLVDEGEV